MNINLFPRSKRHFSLIQYTSHKDLNSSTYNSGIWVLGLVTVAVLGVSGMSLALFSQVLKPKKKKDKAKLKVEKNYKEDKNKG